MRSSSQKQRYDRARPAAFAVCMLILSKLVWAEPPAAATRGAELFNSPPLFGHSRHLPPLYNASACASCHPNGGHGEGPHGAGEAPVALVIRLMAHGNGGGDPVYGQILNTHGLTPEGTVKIEYREIAGYYYPYGGRWTMRIPHYRIEALSHGPLAATTVISPRLAPALFGLALLESLPDAALDGVGRGYSRSGLQPVQGQPGAGRLGWQGESASIRDQTSKALAGEMGLSSPDRPLADCTKSEPECRREFSATADVGQDVVEDLARFVAALPVRGTPLSALGLEQQQTFADLGCAACHRPALFGGSSGQRAVEPYTDLQLHDLGAEMQDETVRGEKVSTRWRTAPLWGIGYRLQSERRPTFLHDGRARSVEEAILWHHGEAAFARYRFMRLGPRARQTFISWLQEL